MVKSKYKIITLTNDIIKYPEYEYYSLKFPNVCKYLGDGYSRFIVNIDKNILYDLRDFIMMVDFDELILIKH